MSDASDLAATLKALGYTLVTSAAVTDAGKDAIITATEAFATQAKDAAPPFRFDTPCTSSKEVTC